MALEATLEGMSGVMSALVGGCYDLVPIPDPKAGPRKVDLALYNAERYRPHYHHERRLPIFLSRCGPERTLARGGG